MSLTIHHKLSSIRFPSFVIIKVLYIFLEVNFQYCPQSVFENTSSQMIIKILPRFLVSVVLKMNLFLVFCLSFEGLTSVYGEPHHCGAEDSHYISIQKLTFLLWVSD